MTNQINLTLRQFPVVAHDHRTGKEEAITVTVTRDQLRAAGVVGQSSKELIEIGRASCRERVFITV